MDALRNDVRFALRSLLRAPAFTAVAVLTLALGIGANTTIYSVVREVLLRPLPYEAPDRLVRILGAGGESVSRSPVSYPNFLDWRERSRAFSSMAAYDEWQATFRGDGEPLRADGASVSASFFDVLGVQPALGRFFLPGEDDGTARALVLEHGFWRDRFGADPAAVGSEVALNGLTYTIVGVTRADFEDPGLGGSSFEAPRFWRASPAYFAEASRGSRSYAAVARLAPDATLATARAEMDAIMAALRAEHPEDNADKAVVVVPLQETIVGGTRTALLILMGAVGLVLLIACANVANLLLTRATGRSRELAVRAALGASRGRVVTQLLVESVVLALLGGAAGVALASLATDLIGVLAAAQVPRLDGVELDGGVLIFTLALSLATGVLFGLLPALHAVRTHGAGGLREGARGSSASVRQRRLRAALVSAEVALSVVLLVGAGLLVRSLQELQSVDPGVQVEGLLTFRVQSSDDMEVADFTPFHRALMDNLARLPGVTSAAAVDILPMSGSFNGMPFRILGRPEPAPGQAPGGEYRAVSPDWFETAGTGIVRGRAFGPMDGEDGAAVAIISQSLARQVFPSEDPLTQRIEYNDGRGPRAIVGIAADVHQFGLDQAPEPTVYIPLEQAFTWTRDGVTVALRTTVPPLSLARAARAIVHEVNPRVPVDQVRTMEGVVGATLAESRFRTLLLGAFAALAFLLGALGIYGVVAYGVAQRRGELAVRLALGAHPGEVVRLVLRQGLRPVLVGLALGLPAALGAVRLLRSLLYGITTTDPATWMAVPALLLCVGALACWVPARRAGRVDPAGALRDA